MNRLLTSAALILAFLMIWGCGTDNSITQSDVRVAPAGQYTSAQEAIALIRERMPLKSSDQPPFAAPSSGTWSWAQLVYNSKGGILSLMVSGVKEPVDFIVAPGSMRYSADPYLWIPKHITISMSLTLKVITNDSGDVLDSMTFEFEPSGLQFDPDAQIHIPFEVLVGLDVETLVFGSESGGKIEDVSYDIDWDNELLIVYVPHFSQYYYPRP